MMKTFSTLSAALLLTACASGPAPSDYADLDCDNMRALFEGQDYAATARGIEFYNDRGLEEIRRESGSPFQGRPRSQDEKELETERRAIREAYRRKGCTQ